MKDSRYNLQVISIINNWHVRYLFSVHTKNNIYIKYIFMSTNVQHQFVHLKTTMFTHKCCAKEKLYHGHGVFFQLTTPAMKMIKFCKQAQIQTQRTIIFIDTQVQLRTHVSILRTCHVLHFLTVLECNTFFFPHIKGF